MRRIVLFGLVGIALLVGLGLYGMYTYSRSQIFNPQNGLADPAKASFPMQVIALPVDQQTAINSWWHAPEEGERTILYLHGNYGNMADYVQGVQPLVDAGYGVLMIDYRGFGDNPGRFSDDNMLEDAQAALRWLEDRGIMSATVVAYGYSLGTGVAVPLARDEELAGVVLAAPFGSVIQMARETFPEWLLRLTILDRFDSLAAAAGVEEPVLIFHGTADKIVPARFSAALADALPKARRIIVPDATHGWDLFETGGHDAAFAFMAGL